MKPVISLLLLTMLDSFSHPTMATTPLDEISRIAFLGDSITQTAGHTSDVECLLISQGHRMEILNIGLSLIEQIAAKNFTRQSAAFGLPEMATQQAKRHGAEFAVEGNPPRAEGARSSSNGNTIAFQRNTHTQH